MPPDDLKNKLVAVLGYGVEGQATTRYFLKHGIKPVLFDQKPWEEWSDAQQAAIKKLRINFIFGPDCFKELAGLDVAFRSPGIPIRNLSLALPSKGEGKLTITSQTEWFFQHCPAKTIGVTGTKGKGTTCALIYEMLKAQKSEILTPKSETPVAEPINRHATGQANLKSNIYLTGNIGKQQPLDILDGLKPDDWVVYELSSFQLQDLKHSPHIAVVLMITREHLDYHQDEQEYVKAKEAIVKFQSANDFAVINSDFENSIRLGKLGIGKKIYFSRKSQLPAGCFTKDGQIVVKDVLSSNFQLPTSNFKLKGEHNLENVCAAILAALCAGSSAEAIQTATASFKGLEHRLEFVAERGGIKFYDDSFSTTPETAIAAIQAFSEPEIVILGGSSKHSDFSELAAIINSRPNIKALVLIGEEAPKIKTAITHPAQFKGKLLEDAKNMDEIFAQIKTVAKAGDIVLFSPACASFDMFNDYQDRGRQFQARALSWKNE
jgi:UDP-N-acetylmuramoylalanine--D-glutamate ligase